MPAELEKTCSLPERGNRCERRRAKTEASRAKAKALKTDQRAAERLASHEQRVAIVAAHEVARKAAEAGKAIKPPTVALKAQPGTLTHEGAPCPIDGTTQKYTKLGGSCVHCDVVSSMAGMVRKWNMHGDFYANPR